MKWTMGVTPTFADTSVDCEARHDSAARLARLGAAHALMQHTRAQKSCARRREARSDETPVGPMSPVLPASSISGRHSSPPLRHRPPSDGAERHVPDCKESSMKCRKLLCAALGALALFPVASFAQASKPNIMFIMGDDIGWMQPSIYHGGLMVGETPNIDRIGREGAKFMTYYAEQSCTAGRTAFITGMQPVRVGMVLPEIPGSPSYLRAGTPHLAKFLYDLGYSTGEFGKNHLGDTTESLPTAHGFQEFWGYLYHLDAMQGVSFPDINKTSTEQGIAPPCRNTPIPGMADDSAAV